MSGGYAHETRIRVRYADTDMLGVVYYANYLVFFEAARVELMRDMGGDYRELEQRGVAVPVLEANCRYLSPARFDDLLLVRTRAADVQRASFAFEYQVTRESDQAAIALGRTLHVCVDRSTLRPIRVPLGLLDMLRRAEVTGAGSAEAAEADGR